MTMIRKSNKGKGCAVSMPAADGLMRETLALLCAAAAAADRRRLARNLQPEYDEGDLIIGSANGNCSGRHVVAAWPPSQGISYY